MAIADTTTSSTTQRTLDRQESTRDVWHGKVVGEPLDRENFRVTAYRRGHSPIGITEVTEEVSWTEESAVWTGQIQVRKRSEGTVRLGIGDEVRLYYRLSPYGAWREMWRLRVTQAERDYGGGTRVYQLESDLGLLDRSTDYFKYVPKKDSPHPHGWTVRQVIQAVCHRYGVHLKLHVPLGHKLHEGIKAVTHPVSPYYGAAKTAGGEPEGIIGKALHRQEAADQRGATGKKAPADALWTGKAGAVHKYVVHWRKNTLHISRYRPGKRLLLLGGVIADATLTTMLYDTQLDPPREFADSVTVVKQEGMPGAPAKKKKTSKKKGHRRKRHVPYIATATLPRAIKRYGYVHRVVVAPGIHSPQDAHKAGKAYLAQVVRPQRSMTIDHPGIPGLHRGDAIKLTLPFDGSQDAPGEFRALRQVVFVETTQSTLNSSGYSQSSQLTWDDPYLDERQLHVWDALDYVATSRNRPAPKKSTKKATTKTSKQQQQRTNHKPAHKSETWGSKLKDNSAFNKFHHR